MTTTLLEKNFHQLLSINWPSYVCPLEDKYWKFGGICGIQTSLRLRNIPSNIENKISSAPIQCGGIWVFYKEENGCSRRKIPPVINSINYAWSAHEKWTKKNENKLLHISGMCKISSQFQCVCALSDSKLSRWNWWIIINGWWHFITMNEKKPKIYMTCLMKWIILHKNWNSIQFDNYT